MRTISHRDEYGRVESSAIIKRVLLEVNCHPPLVNLIVYTDSKIVAEGHCAESDLPVSEC